MIIVGVDYINASYIKGYEGKCSYIATASPVNEQHATQFWQMVYEQKVSQIVMVTFHVLFYNTLFKVSYVVELLVAFYVMISLLHELFLVTFLLDLLLLALLMYL